MKQVLNLYAGIGGNRKLWEDVDVTAVEINPKIADYYQSQFPSDTVVVGDAHEYLKNHYNDGWDLIWSSTPCQTHSKMSKLMWESDTAHNENREPEYPDMRLYQEVLFLQHFADCRWVVENVQGYYEPLIEPHTVGRHFIWSNFFVSDIDVNAAKVKGGTMEYWQDEYGFDVSDVDLGNRKDQVLKNCVHPEIGKHVFKLAFKERQGSLAETVPSDP